MITDKFAPPVGLSVMSRLYGLALLKDWNGGDNNCKICYTCRSAFTTAAGGILTAAALFMPGVAPVALGLASLMSYETYYSIARTSQIYESEGEEFQTFDNASERETQMLQSFCILLAAQILTAAAIFAFPATGAIALALQAAVVLPLVGFAAFRMTAANWDKITDERLDGERSCWNKIGKDIKDTWFPSPAAA